MNSLTSWRKPMLNSPRPRATRARYAKIFQQFREWVSEDGLSALPASGAVVGTICSDLRSMASHYQGSSRRRIAIRYYHCAAEAFLDEAYILAAIEIIRALSPR